MGSIHGLAAHRRLTLGVVFGLGVCAMLFTGGSAGFDLNSGSLVDNVTAESHEARNVGIRPLVAEVVAPAPLVETISEREQVQRTRRTILQVYCCPTAYRGFAAQIERVFANEYRNIDLRFTTRTDRDCVGHLVMGRADAAIISTTLSKNERANGLEDRVLAHLVVVPVVHLSNPIKSITPAALQTLLNDNVDTWRALGGGDMQIQPVCKRPGRIDDHADRSLRVHGKAEATTVFMNDPRAVLGYVANQPRAFGLVSLVLARDVRDVRILKIGNTTPSAEALERRAWPIGATIRLVIRRQPNVEVRALLEFLQTEMSEKVLRQEFVLPTRK